MRLRSIISIIAAGAFAAALLAQIGCSSRPSLPEVSSEPYQGPALALDSSQPEYAVVIQAPTPGWVVSLDRVAEQYRHHAVFVSLRRPNPGFLYPQAIVEQRVATPVPVRGAVRVYARILAADVRESKAPYVLATKGDGTPAAQ